MRTIRGAPLAGYKPPQVNTALQEYYGTVKEKNQYLMQGELFQTFVPHLWLAADNLNSNLRKGG
jgi:hypothetical protein